jgi:microcystin-dependent protein
VFALLGTFYGGNGINNFALPNLQGRLPIHTGNGFTVGQLGGEVAHTLQLSELPSHSHQAVASSAAANTGDPTNNLWAVGNAAYNPSANTSMSPACLTSVGGNQPHENRPPCLTLNFCIAMAGIFPSRS